MEALVEAMVGQYLSRNGSVFICPQFNIAWDKELKQGGARPDFVALDVSKNTIVVVEVTTNKSLSSLLEKVENRCEHWFPPIKRHLSKLNPIFERWDIEFLGFVPERHLQQVRQKSDDVVFVALEQVFQFAASKS